MTIQKNSLHVIFQKISANEKQKQKKSAFLKKTKNIYDGITDVKRKYSFHVSM